MSDGFTESRRQGTKLRIAFGVEGTLHGNNQEKVLKLFHWIERKGHSLTIWSSCRSCSIEIEKLLQLNTPTQSKEWAGDYGVDPSTYYFDMAVESEPEQVTQLAARSFILVSDIPEDDSLFEERFGDLL